MRLTTTPSAKRPRLLIGLGLSLMLMTCGHAPRLGNVALHVHVANDVLLTDAGTPANDGTFSQVRYLIKGVGLKQISGDIHVDVPAKTFDRLLSHVPVGSAYGVQVSATSPDGVVGCTGMATFDVKANATTPVDVALTCKNVRNGQIGINLSVQCPWFQVTTFTASPLAASVGGQIDVEAVTTRDVKDSPVSITWSAPAGEFDDITEPMTTYTCGTAGHIPITVTATTSPCETSRTVVVTCIGDAGAPD